jgi:UDP-N-acetyl-D-mannosaminuronate dehydrogenase
MNSFSKILILGYGQVGQAISQMYDRAFSLFLLDPDKGFDLTEGLTVDVMDVTIPYTDKFDQIILEKADKFKPKLIIIHSTVAPGITERIESHLAENQFVVHSPVRGKHPNLVPALKQFVKYIGGNNKQACELADEHLRSLGYETHVLSSSRASEVGKLLSTTYYGLLLAWHDEMKRICEDFVVPFEEAFEHFNRTYNEGYKELGMDQFVRPTLKPPGGKIGGHCVVPNF